MNIPRAVDAKHQSMESLATQEIAFTNTLHAGIEKAITETIRKGETFVKYRFASPVRVDTLEEQVCHVVNNKLTQLGYNTQLVRNASAEIDTITIGWTNA